MHEGKRFKNENLTGYLREPLDLLYVLELLFDSDLRLSLSLNGFSGAGVSVPLCAGSVLLAVLLLSNLEGRGGEGRGGEGRRGEGRGRGGEGRRRGGEGRGGEGRGGEGRGGEGRGGEGRGREGRGRGREGRGRGWEEGRGGDYQTGLHVIHVHISVASACTIHVSYMYLHVHHVSYMYLHVHHVMLKGSTLILEVEILLKPKQDCQS